MKKALLSFFKTYGLFILLISGLSLSRVGVLELFALPIWLYFWRTHEWKSVLVISFPLIFLLSFINQYGMVPLPLPMLIIVTLITSLIFLFPFLLDRIIYQKLPFILQLLFLPAAANIFGLFMTKGPTGAMGYIGNSLVDIPWLMQFTSVIGIFGIGFLMYLFATIVVHLIQKYQAGKFDKITFSLSILVLVSLILFGYYRINEGKNDLKAAKTVRIATITDEQTAFGEVLYKAQTGEEVKMSREISQADPFNQIVSQALLAFKDNSDEEKFIPVWKEIDRHFNFIMSEAKRAVTQGAKIIVLSEAEIITTKAREKKYIDSVRNFAASHQVYFFLGMGSMLPDLAFPEHPFIENKILVVNAQGEIEDIYFKNIPVKGADPSVPGDGVMRSVDTPYGNIAYAICYDTDFPELMRQVGILKADILLVPTGDWKAISPYHTKITNIRAIENGFAQVRAVSSGLSSAVDSYGNYLATDDFFEDFDHLMIADVPIKSRDTIYTQLGDLVNHLSLLIIIISIAVLIYYLLANKKIIE